MRYQRVGVSLFGAIALIVVVLAVATVWLFLTESGDGRDRRQRR